MNKNLIIRADASVQIGMGHVMRCIALAQVWQDQGGDVTFLSYCDSEALRQRIIDEGFDLIPIEKPHPDPHDLSYTLDVFEQLKTQNSELRTWVVIDGYHFTPHYHEAIRENGYRLLVIDDMAHLDHYHADILLNQNIHASSLHYSCDRDTVKLLGCEYVLLRKEFLKYKGWRREIPEKAKKILVTMGGADPDNVTLKVIRALNSLNDPYLEVKIVAGPANPNINNLERELYLLPFTFHLLANVSNMPELMAWADVAISAGGSTCWEIAFMGLPSLIITLADNQDGIAEGLGEAGAGIDLGWHENISIKQCTKALKEILQDKNKMSRLSEQGQKLVNGKGSQKVIKAMLAGQIKLRRAQENDCKLLWKWANDPEVRQSAFNSKKIAWEDHQAWFSNKQNDPDCVQYIASNMHDVPIGQLRFDIKDSVAEIDYSVDKDFRGMGLGKILLKEGVKLFCAEENNPITIRGCVKKGNESSNRIFQGAGFLKVNKKTTDENDIINTHIIYQLRFFPKKTA
jgi:UDP-2,4-diacetamido-2,4,6-trideoxy-beta-L-altropyranose hydrolase